MDARKKYTRRMALSFIIYHLSFKNRLSFIIYHLSFKKIYHLSFIIYHLLFVILRPQLRNCSKIVNYR